MEEIIIMTNSIPNQEGYNQFSHWANVGISLREAEREFNINHQTISRWVARGIIPVIGKRGKAILIDKSFIAYCASIYHASDTTKGKWLFTGEGAPYKKKLPKVETLGVFNPV